MAYSNKYLAFTGNSGCYAELPLSVLPGATTFTIEIKFATTSTNTASNNYQWSNLIGREISGNWKDDFGLCVNGGKLCFWAEPASNGSSSTNNTVSNAVVNDGIVHSVAVVSNNGAIDLWCDGVKVARTVGVNAKIASSSAIRFAFNGTSYLRYNLYEARLWNVARDSVWADIDGTETGLQAWYLPSSEGLKDYSGNGRHATLYGTPAFVQNNQLPLKLNFDTEIIIRNPPLEWRYENYGTTDLLVNYTGTTLTDLPATQSKTGSAFYGNPSNTTDKLNTPAGIKEIWIKFDMYLSSSLQDGNRFSFGHYSAALGGYVGVWNGAEASGNFAYNVFLVDAKPTTALYSGIKGTKGQLHKVLLHMVSASSGGKIELKVNGTTYTYTGNVNNGADFNCLYFYSNSANILFSNIIVSNAPISIDEDVQPIGFRYTWNFDTCRNVKKSFEIDFDTLRILTQAQAVTINFDTLVNIVKSVNNNFDTSRNVKKSVSNVFDTYVNIVRSVRKDFDTARALMHKITMTPAQDGILYSDSDDNTDLQAISIDIAPQQITDQLSFTSYRDFDILEQVKGQYLDYHFKLRVENTTERGIFVTCNCCSDIDDLLYSQIAYKIPQNQWQGGTYQVDKDKKKIQTVEKTHSPASSHIQAIARVLKLKTVMLFNDFISTVDIEQGGVTYQDLISEIFGWSARIPHKIINCFIRDGTLYVIQRGYEQNTIDLTNCHIEKKPVKKKSLVRTTWGVTPTTATKKRTIYPDKWTMVLGREIPEDELADYKEPEDTSRILPEQVVTKDEETGITTTINYEYDSDGDVIRTETITEGGEYDSKVVVTNEYEFFGDQKQLVQERTEEYEKEEDSGEWVKVDSKVVTHTYTQQGQQHILGTDEEGGINGSITAPARNDDRPTPYDDKANREYTVEKNGHTFTGGGAHPAYTYVDGRKIEVVGHQKIPIEEEYEIEGLLLFDSNFPVEGDGTLQQITNDIKWLNRKTMETLTLNVFGLAHVVDLNDAIYYKGERYFLENNHAEKNNRIINKQSLQLVRWY